MSDARLSHPAHKIELKKHISDFTAIAAQDLMNLFLKECNAIQAELDRQALANEIQEVKETYTAPLDRWLIGRIHGFFRTRRHDIEAFEKKIKTIDPRDKLSLLKATIIFLKDGQCEPTSASRHFLKLKLTELKQYYPIEESAKVKNVAEHDQETVMKSNYLDLRNAFIRIAENYIHEVEQAQQAIQTKEIVETHIDMNQRIQTLELAFQKPKLAKYIREDYQPVKIYEKEEYQATIDKLNNFFGNTYTKQNSIQATPMGKEKFTSTKAKIGLTLFGLKPKEHVQDDANDLRVNKKM